MDIFDYDYYGNDKESNNFSFSVQEIHKQQREKEKKRLRIYEMIASQCFKKIKETSLTDETFLFFQLPEYIPGYPIYNMTECVIFLLNCLHEKGFHARYVDNFIVFISWNTPKPNLKMIEPPKNVVESLPLKTNLQYKPIESYQAFSRFTPMKKNFSI